MAEHGIYNREFPIGTVGLKGHNAVYYNLLPAELCEEAIRRGEAVFDGGRCASGIGPVSTPVGSAKDKFVVCDDTTRDQIWMGTITSPMSPEHFALLKADMLEHAARKGSVRAGSGWRRGRVQPSAYTRQSPNMPGHAQFIRNLLIRPDRDAH